MKFKIGLLLVSVMSILVHTCNIDRFGSWYDEKITIGCVNGIVFPGNLNQTVSNSSQIKELKSIDNIYRAVKSENGGNNLLYNLLLAGWTFVFGNSDLAIRLLSVLFAFGLIPLVFKLVLEVTQNQKAALMACLFLAIQPLIVTYSHQARAYTMGIFLTLCCSLFFFRILYGTATKKDYVLLVLFAIASIFTHYLTGYIFIGYVFIALIYLRDKSRWLKISGVGLVTMIFLAAWYYWGGIHESLSIIQERNNRYTELAGNFKATDNTFFLPATLPNIVGGLIQTWLPIFGNQFQNFGFRLREIIYLLVIPVTIIWGIGFANDGIKRKCWALCILILSHSFISILLALKSGHCISFQPLYASFVTPYAAILIAIGISAWLNKKARISAMILLMLYVIISFGSLYPILTDSIQNLNPRQKNPYEAIAKLIENKYQPGDIVLFPKSEDAILTDLYLGKEVSIDQQVVGGAIDGIYILKNMSRDSIRLFSIDDKIRY